MQAGSGTIVRRVVVVEVSAESGTAHSDTAVILLTVVWRLEAPPFLKSSYLHCGSRYEDSLATQYSLTFPVIFIV